MASDAPGVNAPPSAVLRSRQERLAVWVRNDPIRLVLYVAGSLVVLLILGAAINNLFFNPAANITLERLVRLAIFGLAQGSIYALVALGYTLVYGILLLINFAHSEVFMSGAYIGFFAMAALNGAGLLQTQPLLSLLITMGVAVIASMSVAFVLERIAYRPLRGAPRLVPLITAIGASITLQQIFLRLFGSATRTYPDLNLYVLPSVFRLECSIVDGQEVCLGLDVIRGIYEVDFLGLALRIRPLYFIVFFVAAAMMIGLWLFVKRTRTGKAMRAVAEDKKTAALMGINVDRVIVITFLLGAALAGVAAVLFALYNRQVTPFMGFAPGIKAFTAAVLGGIGNIPGAMMGGMLLGMIESIAPSLLGIPSQLEDVIAFGILILILIFRPTGILGEVLSEKKA